MKKHGNYEKRPEGAAEKQPKVKSALLQAYFSSLLCMVLCVTMFLGTSYAWFTSEVSNAGNEIYIGVLKVELEKQLADGTWASLSEKENDSSKTNLFNKDIRWEPGYTSLETVKVVNRGDLAFKYALHFTDGTITDGGDLSAVAGCFDVWVFNYRKNGNVGPVSSSYADITAQGSGWEYIGTLADALSGKAVLEEKIMETVRDKDAATPANPGTTDGVATEDLYTIALHMKEEAATAAAVMGQKISLNVKLIAYQMGKEQDSFGNRYDQMVATADELKKACQNGGTIALAADINMSNTQAAIPAGVSAILDLNGHKITGKVDHAVSLITNEGNLTIQGDGQICVVFDGPVDNSKAVNAVSNKAVMTVNGGVISNTGTGNQIGYGIDNYNGAVLTVNGGEITASGSSAYDGIRLFCGSNDTVVTINDGNISSIWAQNTSANKATEVKGTVIVNGGAIATVYYENYTTVKVADGVHANVTAYGAGSDKTAASTEDGYIASFKVK